MISRQQLARIYRQDSITVLKMFTRCPANQMVPGQVIVPVYIHPLQIVWASSWTIVPVFIFPIPATDRLPLIYTLKRTVRDAPDAT